MCLFTFLQQLTIGWLSSASDWLSLSKQLSAFLSDWVDSTSFSKILIYASVKKLPFGFWKCVGTCKVFLSYISVRNSWLSSSVSCVTEWDWASLKFELRVEIEAHGSVTRTADYRFWRLWPLSNKEVTGLISQATFFLFRGKNLAPFCSNFIHTIKPRLLEIRSV